MIECVHRTSILWLHRLISTAHTLSESDLRFIFVQWEEAETCCPSLQSTALTERVNESDTVPTIMSVTVQTHDEVGLTHHSSHILTAGNVLVLLSCSAYLIFQQQLAAVTCEIFRKVPVFDRLVLHN